MKTVLIRLWGMLLLAGVLVVPSLVQAQAQPKVVTLGADLTEPQRQALLSRFGTTEGVDKVLTIATPEMVEAMQDIIPIPEGYTSVSSTALSCGAPGSGLHVTTENITRVTAGMYAGALLVAGVSDGELVVAAPPDAPAEGMTALTGVFKGFVDGACGRGEVDPARRELAYRWLATTTGLGNALGDQNAAARVVLRAQQALAASGNGDPALADQALNAAVSETGVSLQPEQQEPVLDLLRRMAQGNIDWGAYASGWELQEITPNDVRLLPRGLTLAAAGGTPLAGSVRSAAAPDAPLVIDVPGQTQQLNLNANSVTVTRDGQPAQLVDLQAGDSISLELGEGNSVRRIDAQSAGATSGALGRIVVGTVDQNVEGQLVLRTATGPQEFGVPAGTYIAREGQASELGAITAQDSAVVVLDPTGTTSSIFANPQGGEYVIEGTLNEPVREQVFTIRAGSHSVLVPVPPTGVQVTRNGQGASLTDIQTDDRIQVRFNAQSQPVAIDAQSGRRFLPGGRWWLLLVPLLLLLLLLLVLGRRRNRTILVLPGRRRRQVDPNDIDGLLG